MQVIRIIRSMLRDFLWTGSTHRSRARMRWSDYCAHRKVGGLNLIDPEEALHTLFGKWITKVLSPGSSNIQILLCYKIYQTQPAFSGSWPASPRWILGHKFEAHNGSKGWNRIIQAWRRLTPKLEIFPLRNHDKVLSTPLWYSSHFIGFNFGISPQQAAALSHKGVSILQSLWN
jgi:hypothetical protein